MGPQSFAFQTVTSRKQPGTFNSSKTEKGGGGGYQKATGSQPPAQAETQRNVKKIWGVTVEFLLLLEAVHPSPLWLSSTCLTQHTPSLHSPWDVHEAATGSALKIPHM